MRLLGWPLISTFSFCREPNVSTSPHSFRALNNLPSCLLTCSHPRFAVHLLEKVAWLCLYDISFELVFFQDHSKAFAFYP
jgi:hypothetical protein